MDAIRRKNDHVSQFIIYNPLRATNERRQNATKRKITKQPEPHDDGEREKVLKKNEKKTDREVRKRVERVARLRRKMLLVMLQAVQPATYTDVL